MDRQLLFQKCKLHPNAPAIFDYPFSYSVKISSRCL